MKTAEIRLKYKILAEREINVAVAEALRDFDVKLQSGVIPAYALRLVTDEAD